MQTGGARMWLMAGVVAGLCGGGCYDDDPTGPRRLAAPAAQVLVTADTACVRARFDLTGPTTVPTQFPERTDCAASLVLIRAQPAQWSQSPNRQLRVFVRILNTSGGAIQLPVRLYLSPTGTTVDVPAGTPASKVVPLNADSTDAAGGKIWFLGGTSVLAVGDSTALDTLGFNVQSPVDQARWQFQATAQAAGGIPAIPDSVSWPVVSPLLAAFPGDTSLYYYRDVLGIEFDSTVTPGLYSGLLASYQGTLIGGIGAGTDVRYYVVRFPDPGSTFAALDSLTALLRAEPGVRNVLQLSFSGGFRLKGRYPNDAGIAPNRLDWIGAGTAQTWPWRAIRAPLAWGCETGAYGGAIPKTIIADAIFDALPSDLTVPTANIRTPAPGSMVTDPTFAVGSVPHHGVAVASIFGATGNNGVGMTGMVWNNGSNLELYAFGSGQQRAVNAIDRLSEIVDSAIRRNARILSFSFGIGGIQNSSERTAIRQYLTFYLNSGPDRLLILATGDNHAGAGLVGTLTSLSTRTDALLDASDGVAAELLLNRTYQGRILLVTGTNQNGTKAPGSHVWTGKDSTILAAPAVAVHTSNAAGQLGPWTGTSFAVPFVTGVAAQLWAMDPSLTASDVVGYLVEGAKQPRIDSITGAAVVPGDVGHGGVYQLDAYGSLSLLSRERQHLPACGFPVSIRPTLTGQPWVVFTRNGANADSFQLNQFSPDLKFSIAQGGRRLAAGSLDSAGQFVTQEFALSGPSWTQVNSLSGVRSRTYLEEDTVDALADGKTWRMRGARWGSGGTSVNLPSLVPPFDTGAGVDWVRFSPEGSFAVVRGSGGPCPNPFSRDEVFLVGLPSGPATPLLNLQCSAGDSERFAMDATWHPDGTRFVFAERNDALIQSILYPRKVSGSGVAPDGADVLIADRLVINYGSGPDAHLADPSGSIAIWREYTLSGVGACHLTSRTFRGGVFVSQVSLPFSDPIWGLSCLVPVPTLRQTSGLRPAATRRGP